MIIYNIRMDLQSDRTTHTDVVLTSGDVKAYRLEFDFFSQGKRKEVSKYALCIRAKRADGVVVVDTGDITPDGKAFYDIKANRYQVRGTLTMEVALANEDGCYVTTKELVMTVRKGYGNSGLSAGNTTPILAKLMEQSAKAERATINAERIADMDVLVEMLDSGSAATVEKDDDGEKMVLRFRIPRGFPGYAPQVGVDYFTEEDKSDMVSAVLAALPDGDEVSY